MDARTFDPPAEGQREATSTTLQCLSVAARHHGIYVSAEQLAHDNQLGGAEPDTDALVQAARGGGLQIASVSLKPKRWKALQGALPAIVRLKNGNSLLLTELADMGAAVVATLYDPGVGEATPVVIELDRLATVAESDLLLVKRERHAEDAPARAFGAGWLATEVVREKRMFRDIVLAAAMMSLLALAPAVFWQLIVDRVLAYKSISTLHVLVGGMALVVVFDMLFGFLRRRMILNVTTRIDARLSTLVFDRLLNIGMDFFERTPAGVLTRDVNEIFRIRMFLTGQLFGTLLDCMVLLVVVPAMFWFSPALTTVVLGIGAAMVAVVLAFLPFIRRKTGQAFHAEGKQNAYLVETVGGIRTVKALTVEARRRRAWDGHVATAARLRRDAGRLVNLAQTMVHPLEKLMTSGVIALAAYAALTGADAVYVGTLIAFGVLAQRVAQPLVQIAHLVQQFDEAGRAVRTVAGVVNQPVEEGRRTGGLTARIRGDIEFDRVRFRYPGTGAPALDNLSFRAPAGTLFGVVGRSGSGKTTVTRLLQALHRRYDGVIRIDGHDIRAFDLDHLRRSTGVVLQDSFLFAGTIRDNIAVAIPGASFERIVAAAKAAGADEFIERLPKGYDTVIEEGSSNLSGGQRQRIAIARALIGDPPLLILDEATSALDPESEAIINANLRKIAKGRTVVIISHRLSSLVAADAILVLDQGRAADIGRHSDLLDRCDLYRRLWSQQNRHAVTERRADVFSFQKPFSL